MMDPQRIKELIESNLPDCTALVYNDMGDGEHFVSYFVRFPQPFRESGSTSQLWYSKEVGWSGGACTSSSGSSRSWWRTTS